MDGEKVEKKFPLLHKNKEDYQSGITPETLA
jgi:hypothetical protein